MNSQIDPGLAALRKAVSLDPSNVRARTGLATALNYYHRVPEAIEAWRDLLKIKPDDRNATSKLAILLITDGKSAEARPMLEKLVETSPDSTLCIQLAQLYLDLKENEKAQTQIHKAIELDPKPDNLNTVAYILGEADVNLPEALDYARRAVNETEAATSASDALRTDLMQDLAAQWDTLGWIYFHLNQLEPAERYLSAAWKLWQVEAVGDHLGQLYEKHGKSQLASHIYTLALAAIRPNANPQLRNSLSSRIAAIKRAPGKPVDAVDELQQMRTYRMKLIAPVSTSAEFQVSLIKGPKVEEVKFVGGSDELRKGDSALAALKFNQEFPDDGPTRIVLDGLLSCPKVRNDCMFVLIGTKPSLKPAAPETANPN